MNSGITMMARIMLLNVKRKAWPGILPIACSGTMLYQITEDNCSSKFNNEAIRPNKKNIWLSITARLSIFATSEVFYVNLFCQFKTV
jgi:hypothetical protein